jgi:hypothetical protein
VHKTESSWYSSLCIIRDDGLLEKNAGLEIRTCLESLQEGLWQDVVLPWAFISSALKQNEVNFEV